MRIRSLLDAAKGFVRFRRFSREPIVVGGCERSGTTLFQSILSAHPRIEAIAEETWALCHGPAAGFDGDRPIRMSGIYLHLGREASDEHAWRWSEKSPANVFYFREILAHFAGRVRLVQIVRDARDVVTSMHPDNPDRPWVSLERWISSVSAGASYLDHPNVLTVRYEDLVLSYEAQLRRVCDFLGEEFTSEMRDWSSHTRVRASRNLVGGEVGEIRTNSVRKFEAADFGQKALVAEVLSNPDAKALLDLHGYT